MVANMRRFPAVTIEQLEKRKRDYYMNRPNVVRDRLMCKYSADTTGIWHITGGDMSNYGSPSSHVPDLGCYEGRYKDVVDYALTLSSFYGWGQGGEVTKINPTVVPTDSAEKRATLEAEYLEAQKAI
jgi:hypothetical protein